MTQFWKVLPPFNKGGGGGGSNYEYHPPINWYHAIKKFPFRFILAKYYDDRIKMRSFDQRLVMHKLVFTLLLQCFAICLCKELARSCCQARLLDTLGNHHNLIESHLCRKQCQNFFTRLLNKTWIGKGWADKPGIKDHWNVKPYLHGATFTTHLINKIFTWCIFSRKYLDLR